MLSVGTLWMNKHQYVHYEAKGPVLGYVMNVQIIKMYNLILFYCIIILILYKFFWNLFILIVSCSLGKYFATAGLVIKVFEVTALL